MMKQWTQRPVEEANLLNPAFCCTVLTSSDVGYMCIESTGIPYPLAFMVLPVVLHKSTRDLLSRNKRTSLATWIQHNTEVRILFAERVIALKAYTREAILFGILHNWLVLGEDGRLQTNLDDSNVDSIVRKLEDEAKECVRKARIVGQWFASAGSAQTVMALWGIVP
jgi:hypothetical protein